MPRPTQQKITVGALPAPESRAPQLGVYAPMDVRAPQTSAADGLAQALGVLGNIGGSIATQRAAATAKADAEEGQADAELAQVDPERAAHSREYADAAHNTNIIKQYQEAEAAVTEWAATNLDASKPYTEQTAALDAEMKRRLGALAEDRRAKVLIAPRYQKFIETAANGILKNQVEARANEALDTAQSDIAADLVAGGDGRYVDQVQRLAPLLGDRTKAVKAVVDMYINHAQVVAANGGDWQHVFNSLPTEITLPDGSKIPGPGRSPALQDALERGRAAAQQAYQGFIEPQHDAAQAHLFVSLGEQVDKGALITERQLIGYTQPGADGSKPLMTPAQVAEYVNASRNKREQLAKEHTVRTRFLTPDWQRYINQVDPTDPKGTRILTKDDFQTAYDQTLGKAGTNLADPADVATKAVALTKAIGGGLGSETLKAMLAGAANRSTPGAALKMLPAYDVLQANGQVPLYLSPEQTAYYENLRIRQQTSDGAAASPEALEQAAAQYDPAQVKRILDISLPAARKAMGKISVDRHWYKLWMGGKTLNGYTTPAQFAAISEPLLKQSLIDSNGDVEAAVKATGAAIVAHYAPITINGSRMLVPKDGSMDNDQIQRSFDAISHQVVPEIAKKYGATREQAEAATWQVIQLPGQPPVVQVMDGDTGLPLPGAPLKYLDDVLRFGEQKAREQRDKALREQAKWDKHPDPYAGTPLYLERGTRTR